jgi:hypothetical protein
VIIYKEKPWVKLRISIKFNVAADFYGNSRGFTSYLNETTIQLTGEIWDDIFTLNVDPSQGRESILAFTKVISYITQLTIRDSFVLMDAICGGIFI